MSFGSYGGGYDNGGMRNDGVTRSSGSRGEGGGRSWRSIDPEFANADDDVSNYVGGGGGVMDRLAGWLGGKIAGAAGFNLSPGLVDRPGGGAQLPGMQIGFDPTQSPLTKLASPGLRAIAGLIGKTGYANIPVGGVTVAELGQNRGPVSRDNSRAPAAGAGGSQTPDIASLLRLITYG